jgi:hypothetical protein
MNNQSFTIFGGGERVRTDDLLRARQALSHLSYTPDLNLLSELSLYVPDYTPDFLVGLGRLELPTSRLSGVRSNHLSYRPSFYYSLSVDQ